MRRSATIVLAAALPLALLAAGCGGKKGAASTSTTTTTTSAATTTIATGSKKNGCVVVTSPPKLGAHKEPKPTVKLDPDKVYLITMVTNCGSFTFKIDQKQSPNASASFVTLVQRGFFNDTIFHRIVPGFVIQGGDPTGTGAGGPGYLTVDTPPKNALYTHGVVAMAKTGPQPAGTAGSQFFIVTEPNAGLPPDYAIIGKVVSGLAVVDKIGKLGDAAEQPTQTIEIQQASVKIS